jgi:hypothetical protein
MSSSPSPTHQTTFDFYFRDPDPYLPEASNL